METCPTAYSFKIESTCAFVWNSIYFHKRSKRWQYMLTLNAGILLSVSAISAMVMGGSLLAVAGPRNTSL